MSDYEPFEAAQGDPWSTEPVGEAPRSRRDPKADGGYYDDSQVLARVPHVTEEETADSHRHYGRSSSHGRRRHSSQRGGVPAPIWVAVGMGIVAVIVVPFFLKGKSDGETDQDSTQVWQETLAPNADIAPAWSPAETSTAWQQPGGWQQGAASAAMVDAESGAPGIWNETPPTNEWVNAPPSAPYAYNAAEAGSRMAPEVAQYGPETDPNVRVSPSLEGQSPARGWDTSIAPAAPAYSNQSGYQAMGPSSQPVNPAVAGTETSHWAGSPVAAPMSASSPYETQPMPTAKSWDQTRPSTSPSLTSPQPEAVMPGYGNYPAAQRNPYIESQAMGGTAGQQGSYTAAPHVGAATAPQYSPLNSGYPIAGSSPATDPYASPAYPQTAMAPQYPVPQYSAPSGVPGYGVPATAPASGYPSSPSVPYMPQNAPSAPAGQPYYGTGASMDNATPQNVARLNGTIQEPAGRTAYDDRARPSFY